MGTSNYYLMQKQIYQQRTEIQDLTARLRLCVEELDRCRKSKKSGITIMAPCVRSG